MRKRVCRVSSKSTFKRGGSVSIQIDPSDLSSPGERGFTYNKAPSMIARGIYYPARVALGATVSHRSVLKC